MREYLQFIDAEELIANHGFCRKVRAARCAVQAFQMAPRTGRLALNGAAERKNGTFDGRPSDRPREPLAHLPPRMYRTSRGCGRVRRKAASARQTLTARTYIPTSKGRERGALDLTP